MNISKYFPIVILIICVISIFLVSYPYVSISISLLSLVLAFIFCRKNIRIIFIIIIVSISTIVTDLIILNNKSKSEEVFEILKDINFLIGKWNYNTKGGIYIFRDDYSYVQFLTSDTLDNYCVGTYRYSFGGTTSDGSILKHDNTYYFYDLFFNEELCVISNNEIENNNKIEYVLGINKKNYNDLVFMDTKNNIAFKLTKIIN